MRRKITNTVQVLTHVKEKLQFVQAENEIERQQLIEIEELAARVSSRDYKRPCVDQITTMQHSGVVKTLDSHSDILGSVPGAPSCSSFRGLINWLQFN